MKHHPSTIASPRTAVDLSRESMRLLRAVGADDLLATSTLNRRLRPLIIAEFAEQHGAPSLPDNRDQTLKMMFAISYPDVEL